ncbi:MAG: cytochrome c family protein [Planctomycetes bacterium]|nr:cytochrome c family protein [Planctomycetota bacterium]
MKRISVGFAVAAVVVTAALGVRGWPGRLACSRAGAAERPPAGTTVAAVMRAVPTAEIGPNRDPAKVLGVAAAGCETCHAPSASHWTTTRHYNSEKALFSDNAKKYAAVLKIPPDSLRTNSLCVRCHATTRLQNGRMQAISGVSCESCHGAAGGEEGWLNQHPVYGPNFTTREDETAEHRQMRIARIEAAGMVRPANIYEMARTCYQCHLVGSEELVAAGHRIDSSLFEVVSWLHGEVRHNYFVDPEKNAAAPTLWMQDTGGTPDQRKRLMYVAGVLADLEMSLRSRAAARSPAYIASISGRIAAINGAKLPALAAIGEVAPLQGDIRKGFARLFAPMPDDDKYYSALADKVAAAGRKFVESHDGSKLQAVDSLIPPVKQPAAGN